MNNENEPKYQVWEAVEIGGFLPVGKVLSLEHLDCDMDGIFPSLKSWKSFIQGNFLDGEQFIELKQTTIKKWCRPLSEYSHLFKIQVGVDRWVDVAASDLNFTFDYEPYYSSRNIEGLNNYPSTIEITVKATIKTK